jgi:CDP-diglyceride synthetase
MYSLTANQKRQRVKRVLPVVGFLVAVVIWAYSELTDTSPPPRFNFPLWTAFVILCPPSLLTVPLIDVEPGTIQFAFTWFVVGILNAGLYWLIGKIVFGLWKTDR